GFGDIFAVISLSQIVLHLIFQVSAGPSHGVLADGAAHSPWNHVLGFAPGMLLGHLWAALLASALLAHGESALWYFASLLSRALPRPLRTPVLSPLCFWWSRNGITGLRARHDCFPLSKT